MTHIKDTDIYIAKNDSGQRLDKFLKKRFSGMPESLMNKYIRQKRIKINGKRAVNSDRLNEGDILSLFIPPEFFDAGRSSIISTNRLKTDLKIVYEDENILLVDKPSGMIVHSDASESRNTLINHVISYLYEKDEYDPQKENSFCPSLCNRIDRNTSGIVIAAKNAASLRFMNEMIRQKKIRKFYLCVATGIFVQKNGTLTSYLKKDEKTNTDLVKSDRFEKSLTATLKYNVLKEKSSLSLLEIELITGRTHQIRAQLSHIGHPLAGDGKYGINSINKSLGLKKQALYAYKLIFNFEKSGQPFDYLCGKCVSVDSVGFADSF